jgi:hypothetical protein
MDDIVTDLLKPRPTIGLWAHGSACLAQLYLGSVLRNSVANTRYRMT